MLSFLFSILGIIITIFFVVGVHELGHFLVARWVGVKVVLFSIGFGKSLYRWRDKKGTEYVLAVIPLGGYVKMLDEQEMTVVSSERIFAYNTQPFYKKLAIVCAGPLANLVFAFFVYWIIFIVGFVGVVPLIGKITPQSIAAQARMKSDQEIIRVDNEPTQSWMGVMVRILMRAGDQDNLSLTTQDMNSHAIQTYRLPLQEWHLNELKPDPLESLGIVPFEPAILPIISKVQPDSPAASVLKPGDRILAVNQTPINDWIILANWITKNPGNTIQLKVKRANQTQIFPITIGSEANGFFKKQGYLGISPEMTIPPKMLRHYQYGPMQALIHAWQDTKVFVLMNMIVFAKLVTGKVSLSSLGGPISIFQSAGTAFNQGLLPFLSFLAFLSIAIGLINILPIPGLDGGHVLFQVIELVIRRPIPFNVQLLAYRFGLILLFLLMTQAIINDILRF